MRSSDWRLPLQTGEGAIRALWFSAAFWFPASICAIGFWLFGNGLTFYVIVVPSLMAAMLGREYFRRAREMAPADLEVSPTALRVRGGQHDGLVLSLAGLERVFVREATTSFHVLPPSRFDENDAPDDVHALFFQNKDGRLQLLATTGAPAELESFEEVAATVRSLLSAPVEAPATTLPQQVLRCPACRGPVAPSVEAEVACGWCGQGLAMPEVLREKTRAAAVVASHCVDAVKRVLDQPSAAWLGGRFRILSVVLMAAWFVGAAVIVTALIQGHPVGRTLLVASGFVLGSVTGGFSLFRYLLVDRQALRALTLRFSALGSEKAGAPRACRQCRGPLGATAEALVVTCVFCDAPNLMGVDLGPRARAVAEENRSLSQVLARRSSRRTTWGAAAVAGLVLLVMGSGAVGWLLLG